MSTEPRTPQVGEIYESVNENPFLAGTIVRVEDVKGRYLLYSFKAVDGTFSTNRQHESTDRIDDFLRRYRLQPVAVP